MEEFLSTFEGEVKDGKVTHRQSQIGAQNEYEPSSPGVINILLTLG